MSFDIMSVRYYVGSILCLSIYCRSIRCTFDILSFDKSSYTHKTHCRVLEEHAGDFENVDLKRLEKLFIEHLRIKTTDAQQRA